MKENFTYSNGKAKDFLVLAWGNPIIVFIVMLSLCVLYFSGGYLISEKINQRGLFNFAHAVCGDGEIKEINITSSGFGNNVGSTILSYEIVCTEKKYGIHELYFFYLVPNWVVEDENGNLQEEKTILGGGVFGNKDSTPGFWVIQ
jgi:hypothetical protein